MAEHPSSHDHHTTANLVDTAMGRHRRSEGEILVVGLGRFGSSLALTLVEMGYDVLAIDCDASNVQEYAGVLSHVAEVDATNERAMRQLGVADVKTAVVCIGTDIESSVLAVTALVDAGVPNVWAKAITAAHGRILRRVGATHVVFPEAEMGRRVAHLVTGSMLEYLALDEDFVVVETMVPTSVAGQRLGDTRLRASYRVTVVCVKPENGIFTYAEPDTVLGANDLIVVAGHRRDVERFADSVR